MKENKTQKTEDSVTQFLQTIENPQRKADCEELLAMMSEITQLEPKLWSNNSIGFGDYHYTGKGGREGDYFRIGFSPRKQNLTLYLMDGMVNPDGHSDDLQKLGKHKTGKSCLYINKLDQIDRTVLRTIIKKSFKNFTEIVRNTEGWY